MDWDQPREPTPAPTDPGVHYWERHYTTVAAFMTAYFGVVIFCVIAYSLHEIVLYGRDPLRNWERLFIIASAYGILLGGYLWFVNRRRVIAITDTTLHLGKVHIPFMMIGSAKLLSKNEVRMIYRDVAGSQAFLPPILMVLAIRNSNITLMAPRYMPHKVLIRANSQYLVGIRDPERFLAAFEQVMSAHEAERERRRQAQLDPRYSLLGEVLEERHREQETGQYPYD